MMLVFSLVMTSMSFAGGDMSSDDLALLRKLIQEKATTNARIKKFDKLDFDVFSNQKWDELKESHAKDIIVHWPDGRKTVGIQTHIDDLKALFVWGPDISINEHPVKFGAGEWTAVIGTMEGTFSEPMPIGEGKFIQPTGKKFKIRMATLGRWKNGVMVEEYLFWDNKDFYTQIGL